MLRDPSWISRVLGDRKKIQRNSNVRNINECTVLTSHVSPKASRTARKSNNVNGECIALSTAIEIFLVKEITLKEQRSGGEGEEREEKLARARTPLISRRKMEAGSYSWH